MKAAYYDHYGSPSTVDIKEIPTPTPKAGEALVKIIAAPVTVGDARIRAARFPKGFSFLARLAFGLRRPRKHVLGMCFSGIVEAVGEGFSEFKIGDEVCGMTGVAMGTHAEYVVIRRDSAIALKPALVSHEDAAGMLFGGTTALYFLRDKAHVSEGDTVLVNGASGAVGTNAVQLARYFGATVTGVTSGDNTALVQSLGAQNTIDYKVQDISQISDRYDVIIDAVGNVPVETGLRMLSPSGRLALVVASLGQMISSPFSKRILTGSAAENKEDIAFLLSLVADNKLTVVIDSSYELSDIRQAYERVDSGSKRGNVIVRIG